MKKKAEMTKILAAVLLAAMSLAAGCGGSSKNMATEASVMDTASNAAAADYGGYGEYETEDSYAEEATDTSGIETPTSTGQKLIKTVTLSMETKEFDALLSGIQDKVTESGGYTERSEVDGNSYYGSGNRSAWLCLRIPVDKLDTFVTTVSGLGNVTSKSESVDDITLQYVDTESHKKALETEQERLLILMEQAGNMEDIIKIETRLSEIRYELQSYESTLRTYDNQVDYSTVNVDIREVERESSGAVKQSYLEEVKSRLSDNFYDIGQGLRNFSIWLIASLPYLVLLAAAAFLVIKLAGKILKHQPLFRKKSGKDGEEPGKQ